ncbi:DUF1616 domain-containing protein [Haladaptatus sp. R4]|uniref:DUF1616 domain-containing protein n=1 Tax=Haladaptatus sp. R4 TaxID=1679489 RepID=UPI000AB6AF0B|nr:DUF1616 domain-containing protein [Haladaptatus sp. R4]
MSTNSRWWFLDLTLALVLTAVGGAASYMGIGGRLQVALVVPLVVFLPGYVLVSALFPEGGDNDDRSFKPSENISAYAIGGTVRVALAATLSVAIVPMIAALANFTPWGVRLHPILYGIVIFTAVTGVVAFVRRLRVPAENRYSPGLPGLLFSPADRSNGGLTMALNVGIVISVLLLASSAGYAVLHPPQPEPFTEFHPQTNKIDGNTQTMYQSDLASDGVTVNIQNHEGETVQYTVVALLQRVEDGKVTDQSQFAKEQVTVDAGQKKQVTLTGDPALSGDNVRVQLYLYNGPASGQPDEQARIWPVSKSASSDQGDSSDQNQGSDNGQETTQQQTTERQTTAQQTTHQTTQRQSTSTSSRTSSTSSTSTTGGTTTTNGGGISTTSSTTTTTTDDGGFF